MNTRTTEQVGAYVNEAAPALHAPPSPSRTFKRQPTRHQAGVGRPSTPTGISCKGTEGVGIGRRRLRSQATENRSKSILFGVAYAGTGERGGSFIVLCVQAVLTGKILSATTSIWRAQAQPTHIPARDRFPSTSAAINSPSSKWYAPDASLGASQGKARDLIDQLAASIV